MRKIYTSEARSLSSAETRQRIAQAAWALLASSPARFNMDALATAAQVSRATLFNAFGSKAQALAAAFQVFSESQGMDDLSAELAARTPQLATRRFAFAFVGFYAQHMSVLARVRAHAALDAAMAEVVAMREQRREAGLAHLLQRHAQAATISLSRQSERETTTCLAAMCSFETVRPLIQKHGAAKAKTLLANMLQHHIDGVLHTRSGFH